MYDGTCEFSTLPRDYPRRLEKLGIQCRVFAPVQPFVSTHYNYRDHRKILVIDGKVGFTGGVNLADEYINHIEKYGRWKDAAVMLEGEGVRTQRASPPPTATVRWTANGWARWSTSTCSTAPSATSIS